MVWGSVACLERILLLKLKGRVVCGVCMVCILSAGGRVCVCKSEREEEGERRGGEHVCMCVSPVDACVLQHGTLVCLFIQPLA